MVKWLGTPQTNKPKVHSECHFIVYYIIHLNNVTKVVFRDLDKGQRLNNMISISEIYANT